MAGKLTFGISGYAFNTGTIRAEAVNQVYTAPYTRIDHFFAWYITDLTGSVVACDLLNNDVVYINVPAGAQYYVNCYASPDWDLFASGYTFLLDQVINHNGDFYACTSSHLKSLATAEPGVGVTWTSYWDIISCSDASETKMQNGIGIGEVSTVGQYQKTIVDTLSGTTDFDTVFNECYSYTVYNANTNYAGFRLEVFEYSNQTTAVIDEIITSTSYTFDITAYGDGIYYVRISGFTGTASSPVYVDYEEYVLYEFCVLHNCMRSLLKNLLCKEVNPCCEPCDQTEIKEMNTRRVELTKMNSLYFALLSRIHLDRIVYLGLYSISANRSVLIAEINDIWTKLSSISTRCGSCSPTIYSSSTSSNCSTC